MAGDPAVDLTVVGGGLAGTEAAWQAARRGLRVRLVEMRPERRTPAHRGGMLAELVCSNSLRGADLSHAVGLLKEEMRRLGSLCMAAADQSRIPGGAALTVDRDRFSAAITAAIEGHPRITVRREALDALPAGPAVVATGPLTTSELGAAIAAALGEANLAFHDAAAPIVTAESLDWDRVYRASRYGKGGDEAYVNCPFTEPEYRAFWEALVSAEQAPREDFDPVPYFEGCLPVEEMARRGPDTLRFGPLKPVGLRDPRTGRLPFAVAQLRPENAGASLFNLVGFQTSLRFSEQRRVFRTIPGLAQAEFERYGVMHRNMFLCSPRCLRPTLQARCRDDLWFAGQITGVEGYVESAAAGLVAGVLAARRQRGEPVEPPPPESMLGALCRHVASSSPEHFQPMNAAFGLLPPLQPDVRDRARRRQGLASRALTAAAAWGGLREAGTA